MRSFPNLTMKTAATAEAGSLVKARLFEGRVLGFVATHQDGRYFVELGGHDLSFPHGFLVRTDFSVAQFDGPVELAIEPLSIVVEDLTYWRKPGYPVLVASAWLLPVKDQVVGTCYLDLGAGRIVAEPAQSNHAIARRWSLRVNGGANGEMVTVFRWAGGP